jgi:hypothetical protein
MERSGKCNRDIRSYFPETQSKENKTSPNKTKKRRKSNQNATEAPSVAPAAIRFYDNQQDIIKQFKALPYIEAIKVSSDPNQDFMNGDPDASKYLNLFLTKNPDNKYAQLLKHAGYEEDQTEIAFSEHDAAELLTWAKKTPNKKIVLFDWDGTLSILEGIMLPENETDKAAFQRKKIRYREIAQYVCGTKKRLATLNKVFRALARVYHVEFFILTNNPVASSRPETMKKIGVIPETREWFYQVAKQIIPSLKPENMICGYDTQGYKPDAFMKNGYLNSVYEMIEHWHEKS